MSYADAQTFFFCSPAPGFVERRVFREFRVLFGIAPNVGPDMDMVFFQFSSQVEGFCSKDGVDAAYLVADLPTDFK